MGKLRTFFRAFFKSFTSPKYYVEIVKAKFSFSFKYFFFYFFLYTLAVMAYLIPVVFLPMDKVVRKLPDTILETYPADLTITVKNGQVSTNVHEPYFIPFPQNIYPFKNLNLSRFNLLTIDTKAQVTDILKHNTLVLLTKDSVSLMGEDGKITTYPLRGMNDAVINKLVVFSIVQAFAPYLKFVVPVLVFLSFLMLLILIPLGSMFYLLLFSILTWIIGKLMGLPLGYGKYYQIGLHVVPIWITLEGIMVLFGFRIVTPLFGTTLLLVLTIIALWGVKKNILPNVN